jgi:hypothetical protein
MLRLAPMRETDQLKETISFYTHILGFSCNNFSEECRWVHLSKDEGELAARN